jgi:hypothetical protein
MLDCSCHLIVTMRSKMDHVQTRDEKTGRNVVEKLGMAPIQRNGVEYEFDVVGDMNQTHDLIISKTRCFAIADAVVNKPTGQWFQTLKTWLSDGAPAPEKPAQEEREPHEVGEHGERKTTPPKVTVVQNGKPARPYDPETLKKGIAQRVARAGALAADEGQRGALVGALNALFASDAKEIQTNKRHMVLQYLTGKDSSKNLTGAEIAALLPWTSERLAETNEYVPDPMAIQEAALIVKAMDADAGQAALI